MQHLTVQGSGNNASPGGHNYPTELIFNWQNGTDSGRLALTDGTLISSGTSTVVTNSTVIGHPEYIRISGNWELDVNIGGVNRN